MPSPSAICQAEADVLSKVLRELTVHYCPMERRAPKFRDEPLNTEIFYSLSEAHIIIEVWRRHYNTKRPHSALGWRPPIPENIVPMGPRPAMN